MSGTAYKPLFINKFFKVPQKEKKRSLEATLATLKNGVFVMVYGNLFLFGLASRGGWAKGRIITDNIGY